MVYKCEYSGELSKLKPIWHPLRINTLLMVLETMPGMFVSLWYLSKDTASWIHTEGILDPKS